MSPKPTASPPSSPSSRRELVVCAVFLAQLCLPGLIQLVVGGVGGRATEVENRAPAPAPAAPKSLAELGTFPARFQAHLDDTFVLRGRFVPLHNRLLLHGFGVSPHPTFLLGQDGWIFYTLDGSDPFEAGWLYMDPFVVEESVTLRTVAFNADLSEWVDGNPVEIVPHMCLFAHMILMDSEAGAAMCLGRTYLTTEGDPEPLTGLPPDLIVRS